MLTFVAAAFNEEKELPDLLASIHRFVDKIIIIDDGSTDSTKEWLAVSKYYYRNFHSVSIQHTGLPETVKRLGVELSDDDSWILMLDCDERMSTATLREIKQWVDSELSNDYTHVYFGLDEFIDGVQTKSFLKCRLFRKSAVIFSDTIHEDDRFEGQGINKGWKIVHRKSSDKQKMREKEYIQKYQQLLKDGKITQDRVDWMTNLHYFVKEIPND
jgi:glycosyltransferase involved in cell wall biosynthesis